MLPPMPSLDAVSFISPGSLGAGIEVTVASIASPTELNIRPAAQGDIVLARTTEAGTGTQTWYYADTTSDAEALPWIVSSATAGVKFIAVAGAYANTANVKDSSFAICGNGDISKRLVVEVDAQTTGDTLTISTGAQTDSRTLSVPVLTGNATLAVLEETQTFTGLKTFMPVVAIGTSGTAGGTPAGLKINGNADGVSLDSTTTAFLGWNLSAGGAETVFVYRDAGPLQFKSWNGTAISASRMEITAGGALTLPTATGTILTVSSTDAASVALSGGITIAKQARLAQIAGTTVDGDTWHDSTQKALQTYVNGIEQTLSGCIFTQTATRTIANTVTETSLFTTGVGTLTLPANFFLAGKTIRLVLTGTLADTGTPTVRLRLKYGSTTVIDSTAQTLAALTGTEEWRATCELTCRAAGASGTIAGDIWFAYDTATGTGAIQGLNIAPTTATVDTTASGAIDLTWEWGAADIANTVSCVIASVEVIN